jgi:hypothetical protein
MLASPATVARSVKALPIRISSARGPVVSTANVLPPWK